MTLARYTPQWVVSLYQPSFTYSLVLGLYWVQTARSLPQSVTTSRKQFNPLPEVISILNYVTPRFLVLPPLPPRCPSLQGVGRGGSSGGGGGVKSDFTWPYTSHHPYCTSSMHTVQDFTFSFVRAETETFSCTKLELSNMMSCVSWTVYMN